MGRVWETPYQAEAKLRRKRSDRILQRVLHATSLLGMLMAILGAVLMATAFPLPGISEFNVEAFMGGAFLFPGGLAVFALSFEGS